jgi:hypothetical protein
LSSGPRFSTFERGLVTAAIADALNLSDRRVKALLPKAA